MASNIDPTVIQDNVPVDKADMRQQLTITKDEISELQSRTEQAANVGTDVALLQLDVAELKAQQGLGWQIAMGILEI